MQKQSLFAAALVVSLAALFPAGAQVYKWTDEQGRTVISDKPRTGSGAQTPVIPGSRNTQNAAEGTGQPVTAEQSLADKELEFRKRQQEKKETAAKAEEEKQAAARKAESCKRAQDNLQLLESGRRVAVADGKGGAAYMDDAGRQKAISEAQARVSESCGN